MNVAKPAILPQVRARAFTLVEMVTSCLILSMTMLALGYGLKLALVSTGSGATQAAAALDGADIVERVTDDLNEAMSISEKTATAITFEVPDRDDDDDREEIRYQWYPTAGNIVIPGTSGGGGGGGGGGLLGGLLGGLGGLLDGGGGGSTTPGDVTGDGIPDTVIPVPAYTLTRRVNRGDTSVVARDVRAFDLKYQYRTMSPATIAATDRLLWEYDAGGGIGIPSVYDINNARFLGQTFLPSSQLPAGTTSYSITRIRVKLRSDATCDGMMSATVRRISTNVLQPNWPLSGAANILGTSTSVAEVSLGDLHDWAEFKFTGLTGLNPATKLAFVIQGTAGVSPYGNAAYVQSGIPIPANTWMVQSINGNAATPTWATSSLNSMRYQVYGTVSP